MSPPSAITPDQFATFGELLKHLRRRAGLTQRELSAAVGYSDAHLSRLEQNERIPDRAAVTARFVPALGLEREPIWVERLLALAAEAGRDGRGPARETGTTATPPHNLPLQLTSFIGREKEIAEIMRRLTPTPSPSPSPDGNRQERGQGVRLLTLTGPGGCGKTRLALKAAETILADYVDGVWLADLASLSDPALLPRAVATALELRLETSLPVTTLLVNFLRRKNLLLVLDNCEHLVEACAQLAEALLAGCPSVRILATSREGLGVPGERTWNVPPLTMPDPQRVPPREQLGGYEAVQLFVERAATSQAGFELTEQNAAAVAQVGWRLDGMPLAIELAAARVGLLGVEQIAGRLDDRFSLLSGGGRRTLPRHQTLRALIDWSHDLLSDPERILLRRLSVFAGGWTLEAAEAVGGGDGIESSSVLGLLGQLVHKSLVVAEKSSLGESRYRLLETIREYAREQLGRSGDEDKMHQRHFDFFRQWALQAETELWRKDNAVWLDRLEAERDNLRSALNWAMQIPGRGEPVLQLVGAMIWFWFVRGYHGEGRGWLRKVLSLPEAMRPTTWRLKAVAGAAMLPAWQPDLDEAHTMANRAQALYEKLTSDAGGASRLNDSKIDRWNLGVSVTALVYVPLVEGDSEWAGPLAAECVRRFEELGESVAAGWARVNVAWVAMFDGDLDRAMELLEDGLSVLRPGGATWHVVDILWTIGHIARLKRDPERSQTCFKEGLVFGQRARYQATYPHFLNGLAGAACQLSNPGRAARLFGAADAIGEAIGIPVVSAVMDAETDRDLSLLRAQLGEEAFARAWAEGRAMTLEQAVAYALKETS